MLDESLTNHVALVTGASSGLGRAIALKLSAAGAAVVCADLQESSVPGGYDADIDTTTVDLIRRNGGDACFTKVDVRHSGEVRAAIAAGVAEFGRLDILVNSAGINRLSLIGDASEDDYDLEMDINAKGTWLFCKYGIEQMQRQKRLSEKLQGRIVNIASLAGMIGLPNCSVYSQSKASVIGLTRALAIEYAKSGITVNAIAPGVIQTSMSRKGLDDPEHRQQLEAATPVGFFGIPNDIARAALFLAADEAGFITGHTLPVDGGFGVP